MAPLRTMAKRVGSSVAGGVLALGLWTAPSSAQEAREPCDAWDVEYVLSANLQVRDTPMNAGDGTYAVGPGRLVLRFEGSVVPHTERVHLVAYGMHEKLSIVSKAVFWTTTVDSETDTHATPNASGIVADGLLEGRRLEWSTPVRAYQSDGTLDCGGSLCGKFGAPSAGRSPIHVAPHEVRFRPFVFSPDLTTLAMPAALVGQSESPRQSTYLALSGREVKRSCVVPRTSTPGATP
jgi:hypothetical protein